MELLFGMCIAMLLVFFVSPPFSDFYSKSKLLDVQRNLTAAIQQARIVAFQHQHDIGLFPISDDWSHGFQLCKIVKEKLRCEDGQRLYLKQSTAKASIQWLGFQRGNALIFSRRLSRMAVNGVFCLRKGRYSTRIRVNKLGVTKSDPIQRVKN